LLLPLEELLLALFDAPPLEELFEAPPFLAAPLLAPLEEALLDPPFLAAPLLALFDAPPLEELFEAPFEELLPAAFFAVAMLF
jgi:hypothetical protein